MIQSKQRASGITLLEVLVIMAVLAVLGFFLVQRLSRPSMMRSPRITCVNNIKQVGLAFRMWDMNHGDKFPMSLAVTNGGTMDHPLANQAWVHFQVLSNELNTPKILICPADGQMKLAADFGSGIGTNNVSYFVGMEVDELRPNWMLSGDRNLTNTQVRITPGIHSVTTNGVWSWDTRLHNQCGNMGLADGSVQQLSSAGLQYYILGNPQTNRLVIP